MAMSSSSLKTRIINKLNAYVKPKYIDIEDDHELGGYTYDDYTADFAKAIAEAVYDEITSNAKCSGTDSHGDTHDNVGIV